MLTCLYHFLSLLPSLSFTFAFPFFHEHCRQLVLPSFNLCGAVGDRKLNYVRHPAKLGVRRLGVRKWGDLMAVSNWQWRVKGLLLAVEVAVSYVGIFNLIPLSPFLLFFPCFSTVLLSSTLFNWSQHVYIFRKKSDI